MGQLIRVADTKQCNRCGTAKSVADFYRRTRNGKVGLDCWCKTCNLAYQAERRRADGQVRFDKLLYPSIRDGRWSDVIEALKSRTLKTEDGCWLWQKTCDSWGYPQISVASGHTAKAHRLMYQAVNGGRLDANLTIHHICAQRSCVNPEHLQAVTIRENIAEMRERSFYLSRIAELEAAIHELDPSHPALSENY